MSLFGGTSFGAPRPATTFGTPAAAPAAAQEKDIEVSQPPTDGVSSMSWSPTADFLAVGSWDNNVRVYGVEGNGTTVPKAMYSHQGPVLDVTWSKDGNKILSCGADKAARLYDVASGQQQQVAAHDAPIKNLRWIDQNGGILATGSWDKTVKYWDLRQSQPIATAQLAERCYSMDFVWPYLVVACAERKIQIFDLSQNPSNPVMTIDSPLKWQTRAVACFQRQDPPGSPPAPPGYAVGSVEGRVAIQYIKDENKSLNFSFKCHRKDGTTARDPQQLFPVNAISFHPIHGTFSTAGGDGGVSFWDKDSKTRLKTFESKGNPISCTAFNRTGAIFAYAVSYDWHKGWQAAPAPNTPQQIFLHPCKEEDVKRRAKK
ncbi:unnamed protein product [Jaminaea pallidilutea]